MRNLKKLVLTISVIFVCALTLHAQKNYTKDADIAFENDQYFSAIELYKAAFTKIKNPETKAEVLFKTGRAYQAINDLKAAETYYQKAIKAKYSDAVVYLHLAEILKSQMRYPEAIIEYNNFKKEMPSDIRGENGVKSCELAQQWKDDKSSPESRIKVDNMALINSKEADFCPSYANKKYSNLVFTSTRSGSTGSVDEITGQSHSDLYETSCDKNGKWSTPVIIQGIASKVNDGGATTNKKGDLMFMTRCPEEKGKEKKCQLYVCKKQGPIWGEPELLPFNVDSVHMRHPSISSDGNTLYFDGKLPGTVGESDIWMVEFDKKDKVWGRPVNVGAIINSVGSEGYPYISDDNTTLYFSSNYHMGMGGLDLFKAEKDANGKFTKAPENLKYPMNSAGDDFGIIFEGKKTKGYFTSSREGGKGSDDIWAFNLPSLSFNLTGVIVSNIGNEPVTNAVVRLKGSNGDMFEFNTKDDGKYNFKLKENTTYEVTVAAGKTTVSKSFKKLGFLGNNDIGKFTTVAENESKDFVKDFALVPVQEVVRFPAVLYALGKADLLVDPLGTAPDNDTQKPLNSKDSLDFLYQTLVNNPSIVIELQAHTDSRGDAAKNLALSEARAKSCVDYLVNEKKIPMARLTSKGFGATKLLIKDDVINKAKTQEEKEALHQKNRRTVFRIISWDFVDKNAPKSTKPFYKPQVQGEENSDEIPD